MCQRPNINTILETGQALEHERKIATKIANMLAKRISSGVNIINKDVDAKI